MNPTIVLILFCVCLVVCMTAGLLLFAALAAEYALFFGYRLSRHVSAVELLRKSAKGIRATSDL